MANNQTQSADFDISALLDGSLEDLPDLPEYKPFPPGAYKVIVTMKDKASDKKDYVANHPAFELGMKLVEVIELPDGTEGDKIPKAGDECNCLFMMDNEMGKGNFKKIMAAAAAKFGGSSVRDLLDAIQNTECQVILDNRKNKEKTAVYVQVLDLTVL